MNLIEVADWVLYSIKKITYMCQVEHKDLCHYQVKSIREKCRL